MTESESAHPNSQPEFAEFAPVDDTELINDLDEASAKSAESVNNIFIGLCLIVIVFLFSGNIAIKDLS